MRLMKKIALSLTLSIMVIVFLASCASSQKRYQNIGCYSHTTLQSTDKNDLKITEICESKNDRNLATKSVLSTD